MKHILEVVVVFALFESYILAGPIAVPVEIMKVDIQQFLKNKGSSITGQREQIIQLITIVGETKHSVIWKGNFSDRTRKNIQIAIKITMDQGCYDREIEIYKALNATSDPNIEQYGIPRIYYHGSLLEKYRVIAMTLFDGTLEDLYKKKGNISPDLSVLIIFKQAVKILAHIHNVGEILHNDIKPANIFLKDLKVFIGDFDYATLDFGQTIGHSPIFASKNFYNSKNRYPMDDLESLCYSMWYVTGVPMVRTLENDAESEGCMLSRCTTNAAKKERMMQKCQHYKNKSVKKAFEFICADQVICGGICIDYNRVLKELDDALGHVDHSVKLNWLTGASSSRH
ncbi:uncharacterized protein LOC116349589 [Contarinia nasturtii]|uniref:uncharacterized protein LOC116349589 n=1 Tax=Contarinia nasturtii TaxID=265458 RepID=UPI0012D392CB|nr:uncharacterized protein LOC116349589 [Contarinia nasturtii]